jgi:predicted ATP-dependent endonuclease of OLD family
MGDINSLSAGQKSIIHLIFEAYGQDDMKGGVVIIDEPEIHLHYQFQYEYLRILEELAAEQKTQYILVTHSEGFINSVTATYIKRFSLDDSRYSEVHAPRLTANQQKLIEILDNTQAARALFANKVLLVEGQDDEYFFRSALKSKAPELRQEIAIYNAHSKNSIQSWKEFFEAFGVTVYFIKDLDAVAKDIYGEADVSLKTSESITDFINSHTDLIDKIYAQYASGGFYLKAGALEQYTQKARGIKNVIEFCDHIDSYLADGSDNSKEIITILDNIIK